MDHKIKVGKLYKRIIRANLDVYDNFTGTYIAVLEYGEVILVIKKSLTGTDVYHILTSEGVYGTICLMENYWEQVNE